MEDAGKMGSVGAQAGHGYAPGALRSFAGGWRISPLVAVLAVLLLALILPPTFFLVNVSLHETQVDGTMGAFTWANYRELAQSRFFLASLVNTAIYAIGSAAVALPIGTVQALIVERTDTPGRSLVMLGAVISMGIPFVLYVVAWQLILGRAGPVNALLGSLGLAPFDVYSLGGMIAIEGIGFTPLVFLLMSSVFRSMDASYEEASLMSGAGPLRTFWNITLRLGLPGVLAVLLLIFIRAFEGFEVPALVGLAGNINVLTTDIYQSSHSTGLPNYGQSGAYSVCLLAAVAALLFWYSRLSRHGHRYQSVSGKNFRPRVVKLGRWRYLTAAILLSIFLLATGLPLLMLLFTALQPFYAGVTADAFSRLTLATFESLFGPGEFRDSILNTLILGASTASLIVPVAALCAWLAVRRKPGGWLLDQIANIPLVFPTIVLSVAFLNVFVNSPLPLYGTLLSVVIASGVRYLPYGMRFAFAGAMQIHIDLEDASAVSGARTARTFLRIVLPLLGTTLVSAWLLIFLLSSQAVALPLLLVGPGTEVIAVTLFNLWQNGQATELAAMGVVWAVLVGGVATVFYLLTRRYRIIA
jgi:iron(III) transport system permease protein